MSLEAKIEALTAAVQALTAVMSQPQQVSTVTVTEAPAPVAAPVAAPAPVVAAMPAPPVFEVPAPAAPAPVAQALPKAPFVDQKGLIDYIMGSYKTLGMVKGAQIQNVLGSVGCTTINEVSPDKYDALFAGVEALKV